MKTKGGLKSVSEFSREEKIDLLNRIKAGEIDLKELSSKSVIVQDGNKAFTGLMVSVAYRKAGNKSPVVYVGEAKKLIEEAMNNIQAKRLGKAK